MSTNFTWYIADLPMLPTGELVPIDFESPVIHIGMRYGTGGGRTGFILAQPLEAILKVCETHPDDWIAMDECGGKWTGLSLKQMLKNCDPIESHSIGKLFS